MNLYQQGFQQDILNTIFRLTGKTWLKITGGYAIQAVIVSLMFGAIFATTLFGNFDFTEELNSVQDPYEMFGVYEEMFEMIKSTPGLIAALIVVGIISIVLFSWATYFQVLVTDKQIKTDNVNFVETLKSSFNGEILRIFGAGLAMYFAFAMLSAIVGMFSGVSTFLTFLLFVAVVAFMLRFVLVIPKMIIGRRTFGESVLWSLRQIAWLRAFKIVGIGVLAFFILLVAALAVTMTAAVFSAIPFLGPVLQLAVQAVFGGFLSAVMASTFIGLYYRYEENIADSDAGQLDINDMSVSG